MSTDEPGRDNFEITFEEGWNERGAVSLSHWKFVGPPINRTILRVTTIFLPAVFTLWAAVLVVVNWGEPGWAFVMLMLAGAAGLASGRTPRGVGWQLRARAPVSTWFTPGDRTTLVVTPTELVVTRKGVQIRFGSGAVVWSGLTSTYLVVIFNDNSGLAIPRTAFAETSAMFDFRAALDRLGLDRQPREQAYPSPLRGEADYQLQFVPTRTDVATAIAETTRSRNELADPYRIAIGAFCAFCLWAFWPWTQHPGLLFVFVPTFAILGAYTLLGPWLEPLIARTIGRRMAAHSDPGAAMTVDCWFTPEGFHTASAGRDAFTRWPEVHRLIPEPNRVVIMGHRSSLLVVPAAALDTTAAYQRFIAYLSDRFVASREAA